jgi:preprotein translocase subunit SecD
MKKSFISRILLLVFFLCLSVLVLIPTFSPVDSESSYPFKQKINLGLDLQGGLYMVLGIDFDKVYEDEMKNYAQQIINFLDEKEIQATLGETFFADKTDPKHSVVISNEGDIEEAKNLVKEFFQNVVRLTGEEGTTLTYGLHKNFRNDVEKNAVSKSIEVIRNRIDEFGVTEPEIVSLGSDRIVVQLPGVEDIDRAKGLIGRTAKLEFRMVNEEVDQGQAQTWYAKTLADGLKYKKGERFSDYVKAVNEKLKKDIPKGSTMLFEKTQNPATGEVQYIPYIIYNNVPLTGEDLQDARATIDQQDNKPIVTFELKSRGAKIMEELSSSNIGKRMAIILDSNIYSAPAFQSRISRNGQISLGRGDYNALLKEARDLALVLRAGALPVPLNFEEQRIVGPSLGADAIDKAEIAGAIGSVLVFLFIVFYYKTAGLFAVCTLVFNILFVLATLVGLEATLTLPGIAGIALTVGMAVDANIIIYERIKEELRAGTHKLQAVESGFARAFWTILDANLTTAVAALCLINFGTGPIRGFAVTLLIGIFATIYSSYFVGKLMFEVYMDKVKGQKISI